MSRYALVAVKADINKYKPELKVKASIDITLALMDGSNFKCETTVVVDEPTAQALWKLLGETLANYKVATGGIITGNPAGAIIKDITG